MHSTSRVTYEKIYENSEDVHVRNQIVHCNPEDTVLYKDARFKVGVPYPDIQDLFEKGVLIKDGVAVYKPTEFGYDDVLDLVEEGLMIAIPYIGYYKQTAGAQQGEFETTFVKAYGMNPNIPPPPLFSITFSAAAGAETLKGATISVFADSARSIPVEDYSEVLPGVYYYTVSKTGFVAEEDSVEIVDQNVEVEVTLEHITYTITFSAAVGEEPLTGATISVFADSARSIPVADYSSVYPGTYYYTITKTGFVDEEDSVEIVDQNVEVEVTLEPITYTITFSAAAGAETLEGATISVFSDQDMQIPVENYSEVLPGTYYYTITKTGFTDVTDSIKVTDKDETVEITLT